MYFIYDPRAGGVLNGCKEDHARTSKQYFVLTYSRKIERADGLIAIVSTVLLRIITYLIKFASFSFIIKIYSI